MYMKQHSAWKNQKCRSHLILELRMAVRTCLHGLGPLRLAVFEPGLHLFLAPFLPRNGRSPSEPLDASRYDLPYQETRNPEGASLGDGVTVAVMSVTASARRSRNCARGDLRGRGESSMSPAAGPAAE
jgi:hypothetical protein